MTTEKSKNEGDEMGIGMKDYKNAAEPEGDNLPPKVNVDELLEDVVGSNGIWQWSIALLLTFSCSSLTTFPVYANSASPHRCQMEEPVEKYIQAQNLSFGDIAQRIGPWSNSTTLGKNKTAVSNGCFRYKLNWTAADLEYVLVNETSFEEMNLQETEPCPLGFAYEDSPKHYPGNVVKEFATVCDRSWLVPLGTSLYIAGMSFGFMAGGWSGGKFGRKYTLLIFAAVELASGLWTSLTQHYAGYVIARAIMGLGSTAKYSVAAIYAMELTVARYRSLYRAVLQLGLTFFYRAIIALWAYLIPGWRWLNVATTAPNFLSFLYFFIPESPRWLISQNRVKDALIVLKSGHRINHLGKSKEGVERIDDLISKTSNIKEPKETTEVATKSPTSSSGFRALRAKYDIRSTLLSTNAMLGVSLSYFGLLFYARIVRNYVYIVGFLNALMTIPDNVLFAILYRYCRHRKRPLLILVALSVLVCAFTGGYTLILKPSTDTVLTIFSNIILVLTHTSLTMLFVYIPELFASDVRTQMSGLIMGVGRFGSMMCTFINELDHLTGHGMPLIVYCAVLLFVLISIVFLRDTTGENLPDK